MREDTTMRTFYFVHDFCTLELHLSMHFLKNSLQRTQPNCPWHKYISNNPSHDESMPQLFLIQLPLLDSTILELPCSIVCTYIFLQMGTGFATLVTLAMFTLYFFFYSLVFFFPPLVSFCECSM